jgi:hypothetical protein
MLIIEPQLDILIEIPDKNGRQDGHPPPLNVLVAQIGIRQPLRQLESAPASAPSQGEVLSRRDAFEQSLFGLTIECNCSPLAQKIEVDISRIRISEAIPTSWISFPCRP